MKALALEILETLVEKDELGRATGMKAPWTYTGLRQHFFEKKKLHYEVLEETVKCLHRDFLVDYVAPQNINDSTVKLTEAGLNYYRAQTRTFV